jgi:hypothetical protein
MKTRFETLAYERDTMKRFLLLSIPLLIALLTACPEPSTPTPSKPTINSFTATPPSLPAGGGSVTLQWDVKDATTLVIDNGVGAVTGTSKTVSVTSSKTFTLTATNDGGSVTQSTSVSVAAGADTTPPTVISIDPPDGATGVTSDKSIVITFSEKMDQAATQSAYQSATLPSGAVTFTWNAEGTTLTVKPNNPLAYASGTDLNTVTALRYSFSLTTTAKDAAGNVLASVSSSFQTLRKIFLNLVSEAGRDGTVVSNGNFSASFPQIFVGDSPDNFGLRGFFSFDLSAIPQGAVGAGNARLALFKEKVDGNPYASLGSPMRLDHVSYGDGLAGEDYDTPSLADLGSFDTSASPASGSISADVLRSVQNDLANRAARGNRSQYRLSFANATDNNSTGDRAVFTASESGTNRPVLSISYFIP